MRVSLQQDVRDAVETGRQEIDDHEIHGDEINRDRPTMGVIC